MPKGLSYALSYTFSRTEDNVLGSRSLDPADQLNPFPEGLEGGDWADGRSDFDVPHRVVVGRGAAGSHEGGDRGNPQQRGGHALPALGGDRRHA